MARSHEYNVNQAETGGIGMTTAKAEREQERERKTLIGVDQATPAMRKWRDLVESGEPLSVFGADGSRGIGLFTSMLQADGDALDLVGKYRKPQKPQFTGSALVGGTFPDNQLKFASDLGRDAAAGAILGGVSGALTGLGGLKRRTPDAEAMVQYLSTPEGVQRMAGDPHFATKVISDYTDEYREALGLGRPGGVKDLVKGTLAGAGKGAVVGTVVGGAKRKLLGPSEGGLL